MCVACVWRVAIAEAIGKEDDGKEEDEAIGRKQTNKESLFVFKNNKESLFVFICLFIKNLYLSLFVSYKESLFVFICLFIYSRINTWKETLIWFQE